MFNQLKRKNIVQWIKQEYIKLGWKFFEFVLEDPKNTVREILAQKRHEFIYKKGKAKKKAEAAHIWRTIKNVERVQKEMRIKFEEYKEQQIKDQAKMIEKKYKETDLDIVYEY